MSIKSTIPMLFGVMGVTLVMAATDTDASMEHEGQVETTEEQHSGHNMHAMVDDSKQTDRSSQDQDSGRIIPQFALQNGAGELVSETDFADRYLLVSFGFTHCPHTCPTILSNWAKMIAALPVAMAERLVPILISVDPERDTPQVMEEYVRNFDERFVGLSGSPEQVAAVAKSFQVKYRKVGTGSDYTVAHTGFSYLISPQRELVALFRSGTGPQRMTHEIRTLLKKPAGAVTGGD